MTVAHSRASAPIARRPSLVRSASALLSLSMARTFTPVLVLAMLALVVLPMPFAWLWASRMDADSDPVAFLVAHFDRLILAVAAPIIALLMGTSAFSAEAEDGTLLYLVTTTTPRWWIATVRMLFAATVTAALAALSTFGTGLLTTGAEDPDGVRRAFVIASAFGGATYAALFTLLSLIMRRSLVAGLGYVLFWEGILSITFPAIHYLSVRQWMLSIANSLTAASSERMDTGPSVTASLVGAAIVFVLAIVLGGRRLHQPRISRIGT
jgi:ABC-2 type transport system permease protein